MAVEGDQQTIDVLQKFPWLPLQGSTVDSVMKEINHVRVTKEMKCISLVSAGISLLTRREPRCCSSLLKLPIIAAVGK
jgi:hypothetical protein